MNRPSPFHMFVKPTLAALVIAVSAMLGTPGGAKAQGPASYSLPGLHSLPELLSADDPLGLVSATAQFRGASGNATLKRAYETNDVWDGDASECEGSPTIIYRALDILPPLHLADGVWRLEAQANHRATIESTHSVRSLFLVIPGGVGVADEADTQFCRQWANATDHTVYIDQSTCGDNGCRVCPTLRSTHFARGEDGEDTAEGIAREACYVLGEPNSPGGGITPY